MGHLINFLQGFLGFFFFWLCHVGSLFPGQRLNLGPRQWKPRIMTMRLPGNAQIFSESLIWWQNPEITTPVTLHLTYKMVMMVSIFVKKEQKHQILSLLPQKSATKTNYHIFRNMLQRILPIFFIVFLPNFLVVRHHMLLLECYLPLAANL